MDFSTEKMLAWPSKHDSTRCHRDSVRGRNSSVHYVCVVRCSNVTIIRNISSNIPTKLTEFINRNCTQDAIKRIYSLSEPKFSRGKSPEPHLRKGNPPTRALPALGVPWPVNFSKAGDGPEHGLTVKSRQKGIVQEPMLHILPQTRNGRRTSTTKTAFEMRTVKS